MVNTVLVYLVVQFFRCSSVAFHPHFPRINFWKKSLHCQNTHTLITYLLIKGNKIYAFPFVNYSHITYKCCFCILIALASTHSAVPSSTSRARRMSYYLRRGLMIMSSLMQKVTLELTVFGVNNFFLAAASCITRRLLYR